MIDHVSIPVTDYHRSRAFYEQALAPIGYRPGAEPVPGVGALEVERPSVGVVPVLWLSQQPSQIAGLHLALTAPDRAAVDAFHAAGLDAGGTDNGSPGIRPYHENYYAAYVLDPDGVNLEAVCHRPA
jgi:catechol 2,3-dioxygenase-like lactoylglutathione lyase family enzyme